MTLLPDGGGHSIAAPNHSADIGRRTERCKCVEAVRDGLVRQFAEQWWPPLAPTIVLVESLQGHSGRDANTNRFLKTCVIENLVAERTARRAAELRRRSRRGSAVDAIVVALAEPGGTVLTGDRADIEALAAHGHHVTVEKI